MIAATFGFGIIPIFLKHFAQFLDPWTVNGVRYSVGALFWLPFLLTLDQRPSAVEDNAPAGNIWKDAVVPSCVNVVGQAAFGIGPYFVPASTMGFVLRLSFLFTIVFGFVIIAEERLLMRRPSFWVGSVFSLLGVAAMFVDELRSSIASVQGMVILLITAVAWGGYAVTVRHYMARYSARQSFGVISIYTSAALVLLMFLFGRVESLAELDAAMWGNLMLSALIGIAFGHVLYYRGIHELGPVVASGMALVTPFVTYLAAALILGERLSGLQWLGGLLVVVGGGLLVWARAEIEALVSRYRVDLENYPGD